MKTDRAKVLGRKFKEAREQHGLTQQDVADIVGINVSHYAKIERGEVKTSFENIEEIGKILKLKLSELR